MNDSAVLLSGETSCWSLLGSKGLNRRRWGVSQAAINRQQPAFDETLLLQSNCDKVKIIMVFYVSLTKRSDTSLLSLLTDVRQLFQQVNIFKVDLPSVLQFASWDFPCIQRYSCGTWNEGTGNEWQLEKGQQDNIWQGLTQIWVSQLTFAYRLPYIASVAYKRMNGVKNYGYQ